MIKKLFSWYSSIYKNKRKKLFHKYLNPSEKDKILDLGGNDGKWLSFLIPFRNNELYVADIIPDAIKVAESKYGFQGVLLDESGKIPFPDQYFDIIFCNSVIEHVTIDKDDIYKITSGKEFKERAFLRQKKFSEEISRAGKKYFVQTPYKHFPIESHTWFPSLFIYLPRKWQISIIKTLSKIWVKKSTPDWNLLTVKDLKILFPEAEIVKEKSFFITKSIIAIKR